MQSAHSHSQPVELCQQSADRQIEVTKRTRPSGEFLSFSLPFLVLGTFFAANAVAQLVTDQAKNLVFVCIWAASFSYLLLGTCSGITGLAIFKLFKLCQFKQPSKPEYKETAE